MKLKSGRVCGCEFGCRWPAKFDRSKEWEDSGRRAEKVSEYLEEEKPKAVSAGRVKPARRIVCGKAQKPRRLFLIAQSIVIGKHWAHLPDKISRGERRAKRQVGCRDGNVGGPASRIKAAKGRNPMNAVEPWQA